MQIGRFEEVPLQLLWPHEANDFTPWLFENIEVLASAIGRDITALQREKLVGTFKLDILAEDKMGPVVVENQLYGTDHDHLGKVLTYLTNLDAKTAIWLTAEARPEHIKAVIWLNESTADDTSFFLVKVRAYKLGEQAAPMFSVLVGPSEEGKRFGEEKKEIAQRHTDRRSFWSGLLDRAKAKTQLHANISPSIENWVSASAGHSFVGWNYVILMKDARVELYLSNPAAHINKSCFDSLFAKKTEIEAAFGKPLQWDRLDGKNATRIWHPIGMGGLLDQPDWDAIQDQMIETMIRLHAAISPHLKGAVQAAQAAALTSPPEIL
jgi:hypothetical protein